MIWNYKKTEKHLYRNPVCKECVKSANLKRTRDNPEKRKEQIKRDNARPKKIQAHRANGKRQRESGYTKEYMNRPEVKDKKYTENHRIHDITTKEKLSLLKIFDYKCAYCHMTAEKHKIKYNERLHDDHVDHEGYNDLRNDVPACKSCNCSKWKFDMEKWFREQDCFTEEKLEFINWWTSEGFKDYIEDKPPYRIFRKHNDDKRTYHFELWTVDEKRNEIECIAKGNKKKDLNIHILNFFGKIGV